MIGVIVSGDDFGLAPAINDGIFEAHRRGCLTSASLCIGGPAAEDAIARARAFPELGIGLHVTLVCEKPLLPPEQLPTLVDAGGLLPFSAEGFAWRWMTGRIRADEVRREVHAQLARARDAGVTLTHVDSHQHLHVLPGILEIVIAEMKTFGITNLRVPLETRPVDPERLKRRVLGAGLRALARRAAKVARRAELRFPGRFLGFRGCGHVDAAALRRRLESVTEGVTEISLHPAAGSELPRPDFAYWNFRWDIELLAACDEGVRSLIAARGIRLMNYGHLQES